MTSTALILRPSNAPKIHVLECDGPRTTDAIVYNYFGTYRPVMSFAEWCAQPEHHKAPGPSDSEQDYQSASRIVRLIESYPIQTAHKTEMLARLELLFPGCTGNSLQTVSNL